MRRGSRRNRRVSRKPNFLAVVVSLVILNVTIYKSIPKHDIREFGLPSAIAAAHIPVRERREGLTQGHQSTTATRRSPRG